MRPFLRPGMISLSALWVFFAAELVVFLAVPDLAMALVIHAGLVLVMLMLGVFLDLPMLQMSALTGLGSGPFSAGVCAVLAAVLCLADLDPIKHRSWYRFLSGEAFARPRRSFFQDLQSGRLGGGRPVIATAIDLGILTWKPGAETSGTAVACPSGRIRVFRRNPLCA